MFVMLRVALSAGSNVAPSLDRGKIVAAGITPEGRGHAKPRRCRASQRQLQPGCPVSKMATRNGTLESQGWPSGNGIVVDVSRSMNDGSWSRLSTT